jgi:hypothetical protein
MNVPKPTRKGNDRDLALQYIIALPQAHRTYLLTTKLTCNILGQDLGTQPT